MLTRDHVIRLMQECLDDLNAERQDGSTIEFSEELALYGVGSPLDSLDFVTFTIGLEERARRDAGVSMDLASLLFDDEAGHPFRSVAALAQYLVDRQGS